MSGVRKYPSLSILLILLYVCIYTHIHTYTHIYTCIYIYTHTYTHKYKAARGLGDIGLMSEVSRNSKMRYNEAYNMFKTMYKEIGDKAEVCIYIYVCVYVCICIHIYVTFIHMHTHTYIHMHTHIGSRENYPLNDDAIRGTYVSLQSYQ